MRLPRQTLLNGVAVAYEINDHTTVGENFLCVHSPMRGCIIEHVGPPISKYQGYVRMRRVLAEDRYLRTGFPCGRYAKE